MSNTSSSIGADSSFLSTIPTMDNSEQQWSTLCKRVHAMVPSEIGEDAWYLIIAASLAVSPDTNLLASFYTHLTAHDPNFASTGSQEHLSRRLRDVLLKMLAIVGGPQVLSVLMPLAKAEGDTESKSAASELNDKWRADQMDVPAIHDRGLTTINTIYGAPLLDKIFNSWGSHKADMKFVELFALYGLFLSDFEYLTPLETEAVVYSSISCLGLGGPGNWHLRGIGRVLGARGTDETSDGMKRILGQLESLKGAVVSVVEFVGQEFLAKAKIHNWADANSVARDLGGWGDDE